MSPPYLPLAAATAAAATSAAVGVALSIRLLILLARSRALKPLAATTSAAAAALRAPHHLAAASSPLAALLAASKAYRAARALDPAARLPSSKRVKAAFAAASSLLRLAAASSSPTAFAALKSGYKLSKNSAKVVEGFLGLQVHKGFRNGVDALGVVVKVAVIASELAVWVGARFWAGDGAHGRCVRLLGLARPTGGLVLVGSTSSSHQAQVVLFDPGTVDEMDDEGCWSDDRQERSQLLPRGAPAWDDTISTDQLRRPWNDE